MRKLFFLSFLLISFPVLSGTKKTTTFPWDRLPGVNADDYKEDFLKNVEKKLQTINSYGRCQKSLADCVRMNERHGSSMRLARDVFIFMAQGASDKDIKKWVEMRKNMAHPKPVDIRGIKLDGLSPLGKADAPVTVVEYSDFQCPFCAMTSPVLIKVVEKMKDKAKLYFKQFPIKGHPRALPAARACVAADSFKKFWSFCPKLFENRDDLSDEKLVELAVESGMDKDAFIKKMNADETLTRIADEKMEGLRNRVQGTPAIFINGKEFLGQPTEALLKDRIEEELDIMNGRD